MSSLDSALIEIRHAKKSLAIAIKQEPAKHRRKYYTSLVGHCCFAEKYVQQAKEKEDVA